MDISHVFGQDLQLSATGDLLLVSGDQLTQQRILRRLLTNAGDYLWELAYGAGLAAMVGQPGNQTTIQNIIRSQIFAEATVARAPEPTIATVVGDDNVVTVTITYADANTGQTSVLSFPVDNPNAA